MARDWAFRNRPPSNPDSLLTKVLNALNIYYAIIQILFLKPFFFSTATLVDCVEEESSCTSPYHQVPTVIINRWNFCSSFSTNLGS